MKIYPFFTLCFLIIAHVSQAQETSKSNLKLWYSKPAEKWTDALPLGNGRIGAMVFAGTEKDQIQFNEETLWSHGPRNYNREGASDYLDEIRQLVFDGKQKEAEQLAQEKFMGMRSAEGEKDEWIKDMQARKGMDGDPSLASYNDSQWKEIQVPTYEGWETAGLNGLDGAVWFRTAFDLPADWIGENLILDLNRIRDHDFTYINGKLVGTTNGTGGRKYVISKEDLVKGKNTLAVQVLNYFDKGGIAGYKDVSRFISIYPEGESSQKGINLSKTWKYKIQNDEPPAVPQFQASYQPFGDIWLSFKGHSTAKDYKRELDLTNAISTTSYSVNGVKYKREYFVSEPHQALVVHLTSGKAGSLTFEVDLNSPHKYSSTRKVDGQTIALSLKVRNGALKGESFLRVITKKGKTSIKDGKVAITGADEVTIYLTAATNYKNYKDVSGDPTALCSNALKKVESAKLDQIRKAHIAEYQQYFNTLSIDLGSDKNREIPTNERIESFASTPDPAFMALYLQYGRYLLISSSRPGTQPANLQGIWNDLLAPPWGSKYTTNINAEMNYWPAQVLNLSPLHDPLLKMTEELAESGKETAKVHYNAPGWVLHHNTDVWRGTAPINASNHGIWVTGGAWLSHHFWEHYLFTQDIGFLQKRGYPVMKEAARFFNAFLVKDPKTGWLISTPSNSPEIGGLVAGPTMDHQIIRNLFKSCIQASEILNIDQPFRDSLKVKYAQIAPNQIGKHGQLQEWLEDKDDPHSNHRHVSHLWGLHPGNEINWDETPELMKAARQSLIFRGDEGTGWSLAWKINFWSRFKDGDHALKMVTMLISPAAKGGGSYINLFDAHPPFQIDGNFGGSAGIAEMLLQSHTGYIDILPALPSLIKEGSVKGICARGGFVLDLEWKEGQLKSIAITSKGDNECLLRYNGKETIFSTQKGKVYKLNGDLKNI